MQTIRVLEKTGKDGMLSLRIPLDNPDAEYEIVVIVQPKDGNGKPTPVELRGWPPGYFDLIGSIDDETFMIHPQPPLPPPVEVE
jgi:hypothetical protein